LLNQLFRALLGLAAKLNNLIKITQGFGTQLGIITAGFFEDGIVRELHNYFIQGRERLFQLLSC